MNLSEDDVRAFEDNGAKMNYFRREGLVVMERDLKVHNMKLFIANPYIFVVGPDFVMNYELQNKQCPEKSFGDLIRYVSKEIETTLKFRADLSVL